MNRVKVLLVSSTLALTLVGCSAVAMGESNPTVDAPAPAPLTVQTETEVPSAEQTETVVPTEETVLVAREQALVGMSLAQVERLTETVKTANLCLEQAYMFNNIFGKLENPDSLYWNYFHQTGEIQIGWAIEGNVDKDIICVEEGLTEDEFYAKYGTRVVANNRYDADTFIALLEEISADVQNGDLKAELQYIINETALARDTHVMGHVNNAYKKLHDLDYFLLRYGPADVGPYVKDDSTISKYYGTLSIYE